MFSYIGKMKRDINLEQIKELLKEGIAARQEALGGKDATAANPENISILDYAYAEAEPNCYIVYASWEILE